MRLKCDCMHVILYTLATCVCIYTLADFYFMIRQVIFLSVLSAFGLKTEPYHSSDPQVRLAKQRLLSMNTDSPGIRFRTGTQMTDLVDVDSSVTNLQGSVSKFSDSLSQVAGIIDVTRVNNGLVPQMQALVGQIKALDSKLLSTHRPVPPAKVERPEYVCTDRDSIGVWHTTGMCIWHLRPRFVHDGRHLRKSR